MKAYFVTGTDTGIGKTTAACALLAAAARRGCSTLGLKPVASGCEPTPDGLRNGDALQLRAASTVTLSYAEINPVALELPQVVEMEVVETPPAMKAASASARTKPATFSTGLVIQVPEYLEAGQRVRIHTAERRFMGRAE